LKTPVKKWGGTGAETKKIFFQRGQTRTRGKRGVTTRGKTPRMKGKFCHGISQASHANRSEGRHIPEARKERGGGGNSRRQCILKRR